MSGISVHEHFETNYLIPAKITILVGTYLPPLLPLHLSTPT